MKLDIESTAEKTIIHIQGRVDTMTSPEFDRLTAGIAEDGNHGPIELACEELEYISSAGLRSFITLLKSAKSSGRELTVTGLSPSIRSIFDMTGFTSIFKIS